MKVGSKSALATLNASLAISEESPWICKSKFFPIARWMHSSRVSGIGAVTGVAVVPWPKLNVTLQRDRIVTIFRTRILGIEIRLKRRSKGKHLCSTKVSGFKGPHLDWIERPCDEPPVDRQDGPCCLKFQGITAASTYVRTKCIIVRNEESLTVERLNEVFRPGFPLRAIGRAQIPRFRM